MSKMTRSFLGLAMVGLLAATAGCSPDLEIPYITQPDRDRALRNPGDLEALISGTFRVNYNSLHATDYTYTLFPAVGDVTVTTGNVNGGQWDISKGWPRAQFNNDPAAQSLTDPTGPRRFWVFQHQIISSANDGLQVIASGRRITTGTGANLVDNTARAQAFAKFMQGVAWSNIALVFDRGIVIDESVTLNTDPVALRQQILESLRPYDEVRDKAIASFEAAIQIAQQNSFTIPGSWFGSPASPTPNVSNQELIRIANSYAARTLVYSARNPQERAQVDWARVLSYTANAITTHFGPTLIIGSGGLTSGFYGALQVDGGATRMHYGVIGPADVSGAYQQWIGRPYGQRTPFTIVTPDRRVTGPTPTARGAYVRHITAAQFGSSGEFFPHHSPYQWYRNNGVNNAGQAILVGVDEIRLIRAEALARTGQAQQAAGLVDVSRTRSHTVEGVVYPGLPPVTTAGVPAGPDCVPRKEDGQCGDLLDAIRYERLLESYAHDVLVGYADNRGWGRLTPGTLLHFPVPGQELLVLREGVYSWGGPGGEWSAPANWLTP